MSYIVIHEGNDGQSVYHEVESLSGAADLVELLRNSEGVENAGIFRLEEVRFAFRPYYHVELSETPTIEKVERDEQPVSKADDVERPQQQPVSAIWADAVATDPALPSEPGDDSEFVGTGDNGHRGLFGR